MAHISKGQIYIERILEKAVNGVRIEVKKIYTFVNNNVCVKVPESAYSAESLP